MDRATRCVAALIPLVLCACSSVPTHYYTLLPPAEQRTAPAAAAFAIHIDPIVVPAEVDQEAWLVRTGASEVTILDNERWAAPLGNELHAAFVEALTRELGAREVDAESSTKPKYTVRISVRRFESVPAQYALIDADWTVRSGGAVALACNGRVSSNVSAGYAALALGHQQAVQAIAGQIATAARSLASHAPACPPDSGGQ